MQVEVSTITLDAVQLVGRTQQRSYGKSGVGCKRFGEIVGRGNPGIGAD